MANYTVLYEPDDGETVSPNYEVLYEPDDTDTVTDDYETSWLGRQWNALGDYITSGGVTNSNIANRILEQEQYQKDLEEEEQKRLANEYYLRNRDTGEYFQVPGNNEYSAEDRFRIDALDPVDLTGFNGAENLTKYQQDYLRDFNPQQYELLTGIQQAELNKANTYGGVPDSGNLSNKTFSQPIMGTIAQSIAAGGDQVLLPADWLIDKGIQAYDWATDNERPEDYKTFVGSARERIENAKLNNEATGGIQGGAGNVLFGLTSYAPMIATSIATGGASAPIQAAAVQAADVGLGKFAQYEDQGADIGTALAAAGIDTVGEFLSDLPLGAASKAQSLFGGGAKGALATLGANALEAGVGNVIAGGAETMADDLGLGDAYNPTPEERMQNSIGAFNPGAALGVGLNVGGKVLGKAGQKVSSKLAEKQARGRIDAASEAMDLMAEAEGVRELATPDNIHESALELDDGFVGLDSDGNIIGNSYDSSVVDAYRLKDELAAREKLFSNTTTPDDFDMTVPGMETNRSYEPQVKIERTETVPQVEGAAVPKDKTFRNVEEFKEHQAAVEKQKVEDPVITKVEPKPVLEKQTDKVDVQRISREELGRRPDLMQFKQSDDKVTGTAKGNRIEGQRWDDTAAGPLLVWEPIDPLAYGLSGNQKYIVANGHHRLEFGDRMNVKDYNVQVLREADGWTAQDVKEKAALDNINDGKGTIEDQVTFLRSYAKQVGPEEALAKAQELGFQRKDATPIAIYGSDDLLNAFRRGKINQTQAAGIARATADPDLQRVGIKFAMQKKDLPVIENYLRNATHANEGMFAGDQISLFGDNDAAINKAMALSELANDYASKLKRRINVVKPAVNNQEIAGEAKVKVLKNADKEVANLIQQADKWDNWALYPELRQQLEAELAAGQTLDVKKKAEKQNWMADPERGATIIFDDLIDGVAKLTAKAKDAVSETVSDIFALDVKDYNVPGWRRTGMDDSEKYLSGLVGKFNKVTSYPRTIAQKFPEFEPTYRAGQGQIERASMNTLDFNEKFQPFLQLTPESQKVVGNLMARNRQRVLQGQKKFDETYQNWRALGLSDIEAKAALQLREGFNLAVDKIVEAKKAEEQLKVATNPNLAKMGNNYLNKKFAELDAWGAELKDKNYMPLSRRGKYYVYTDDEKYFKMFDSKKDVKADLERLSKLGVTGRYGIEGTHVADQLTNGQLNAIGGNHGEIKGFPAHLLEAKGTSGFDTNYVRNIAEYFQMLSRYNAKKLGDLDFNNAKKAINPKNQKALLNYAEKYQKDLNAPNSKIIDGLQKIVVVKALSNPLTSAINMTQPLITTLPECVKYLGEGKALKVFSNAFATQKAINFNKGKGVSKELLQGLEEAKRRGLVGDNATGTMAALAKGEKPNILIDKVLLAGQNATEYINRQHAFIAGWDIAERTGIKDFNQKFDFARSFIEQTQFNTNKGNRNELTRWARLPMTFKNFGGNLFKFYMDNLKGGARGKRAAIESLAIGTLLGGYKYIPLAAALMTMANGAGYDVEKIAKDKLNKIFGSDVPAEVLFQGLGSTVGLNISGNLQSEDYADAWNLSDEHKFYESAGKVAFGASGRTLVDFARGVGAIADGDIYKGIEQMAPRLIQNPMRAYRAYEDNAFTNNKGQPIVKNPTTGELIGQALGMTPKRKNQFYEEQTKNYEILNKLSDTSYMDKAAKAYLDGDMQKAGEYLLEAREAGQKVTDAKFKNAIKRLTTNPLIRQLERMPKDIRAQRAAEIDWIYE